MCCAFADRVNARIGHGLQGVGDDDAFVAMQVHRLCQRGVGANADRHHDQVSGEFRAVFEFDRGDAAFGVAGELLCLRAHEKVQAACFE